MQVEKSTELRRFSTMPSTPQTAPRLIALPEVTQITSLKKTALYELIKAGELRPIKLGRKTVFSEAEICAWVNERLASRAAA
jgi:prophage regulatory protein